MSLQIYRASAGSGKTFRLSADYIKLVLHNPESYKNILAVTFTNAATAEMKKRIVEDLSNLYKKPDCKKSKDLLNVIIPELNDSNNQFQLPNGGKWTTEIASRRAGIALQNILHNYTFFHIETIDSFFQTVLRNMIHELGLGAALSVELDNNAQVETAIQILYDKSKVEKALKNAIIRFSMSKNENGQSGFIDNELKSMGEKILKENFLSNTDINDFANIFEEIENYKKRLESAKTNIENKISAKGKNALAILKDDDEESIKAWSNGESAWKYLVNCANVDDKCFAPSNTIIKIMNGETDIKLKAKKGVIRTDIQPLMKDCYDTTNKYKTDYYTSKLILKQIHEIAFIYDIYSCILQNNKMEGKFLLSDTPVLLNKLIYPTTAPFIYEKIGARYSHIMIDEFQDTSSTQWRNFVPLLIESLSKMAENDTKAGQVLIVGDPKQSIYRWRNGDWTIIENIGHRDGLHRYIKESVPMDKNFRSSYEVVNFNNNLYNSIADAIDSAKDFDDKDKSEEFRLYKNQIKEVYHNSGQKCMKKEKFGYVEVAQLPTTPKDKSDERKFIDFALEKLTDDVIKCQIEGTNKNDIAILTRNNSDMPLIASYFANYANSEKFKELQKANPNVSLDVISNEAFKLDASIAVHTIIDAIRFIVSPDDEAAKSTLAIDYQSIVKKRNLNNLLSTNSLKDEEFNEICKKLRNLKMKPLYELAETIYYELNLKEIEGQESYLYTFLDKIQEYSQNFNSDLNQFLKRWDEKICDEKVITHGDGIQMLTIHKSKGLEYDTVFIPFCNWSMENSGLYAPTLWCRNDDADAPSELLDEKFNTLPIKYTSDMANSLFSSKYQLEKLMMWIDNVNLLYVATTRAKNNLFIYCETVDTSNAPNKISYYIVDSLQFVNNTYKSGKIYVESDTDKEKSNNKNIVCSYNSFPQRDKQFQQSAKSNEFIKENMPDLGDNEDSTKLSATAYGTLIHHIFSKIKTIDDVENAVEETIMEGVEIGKDKDGLIADIKTKLNKDEFKEWFAPGLKLMNERTIAYYEGIAFKTKKPDRVIVDGKTAIIIDYKSGNENSEYFKQLTKYANLLKEIGFEDVSAFIWYLNTDKKVQVV
ncbi:MAG: UvrD-helicase domain-containing protein [Paludibacteraceae bacterium]|nr:UvrD-helicase domain-containing protein [Paludibacteraceae bacterium]